MKTYYNEVAGEDQRDRRTVDRQRADTPAEARLFNGFHNQIASYTANGDLYGVGYTKAMLKAFAEYTRGAEPALRGSTAEPVYLTGIHHYSFRRGQRGLVTGLKMATPEGCTPRLVYEVAYPDGVFDFVAQSDTSNYTLTT